jgi:hypothetical protein
MLTAFIAKSVPHRARETFRARVFKYLIVGAQGDAALKKGMCLALGELGFTIAQLTKLGLRGRNPPGPRKKQEEIVE